MAEREVYLIGRINERNITKARERISKLWEENQEEINLFICSGGGDGDLSIGFYDWIKLKNIPVVTVAIGQASSAAIVVFLSGRKRKATPHSWFLIHRGGGGIKYKIWKAFLKIFWPRLYREETDWEKTYKKLQGEIIEKETKLLKEAIETALTKVHLILTAQEAKEVGLIDEIIS